MRGGERSRRRSSVTVVGYRGRRLGRTAPQTPASDHPSPTTATPSTPDDRRRTPQPVFTDITPPPTIAVPPASSHAIACGSAIRDALRTAR